MGNCPIINASYLATDMEAVAGGLGGGGGGGTGGGGGGLGGGGKDDPNDPYNGLSENEWLKKKLEEKKVRPHLTNTYALCK